jgi:hypothetical protein
MTRERFQNDGDHDATIVFGGRNTRLFKAIFMAETISPDTYKRLDCISDHEGMLTVVWNKYDINTCHADEALWAYVWTALGEQSSLVEHEFKTVEK